MPAFLDLYDGQLLGFIPETDNPYSDYARRAEYFGELPRYDERIVCRLRLDCFGAGYDDGEIEMAWNRIASRAAIIESDQDGCDRVLEVWSYLLIEEYEAGKRGSELLEWFWEMLRKMVQEIYEPGS